MNRYSQNNEQDFILDYFKDYKGTFLDLGAYDGKDLSNTRALMELGWAGMCFEPHPEISKRLKQNCEQFPFVFVYDCAVGISNGTFKLNANDTYYSTLIDSEKDRWNNQFEFTQVECKVVDFATLQKASPFPNFDFISIDCEGLDYAILSQINLDDVKCNLLCIETNGIENQKYIDYCANFGMSILHKTPENLIMAR
jgi:FkbM family methyltransferase